MITINDIQAKLDEVKTQIIELSKQAGNSVTSFAEPDGQIHQQVQADLDTMQEKVTTTFNDVVGNVKSTVSSWFKH